MNSSSFNQITLTLIFLRIMYRCSQLHKLAERLCALWRCHWCRSRVGSHGAVIRACHHLHDFPSYSQCGDVHNANQRVL